MIGHQPLYQHRPLYMSQRFICQCMQTNSMVICCTFQHMVCTVGWRFCSQVIQASIFHTMTDFLWSCPTWRWHSYPLHLSTPAPCPCRTVADVLWWWRISFPDAVMLIEGQITVVVNHNHQLLLKAWLIGQMYLHTAETTLLNACQDGTDGFSLWIFDIIQAMLVNLAGLITSLLPSILPHLYHCCCDGDFTRC